MIVSFLVFIGFRKYYKHADLTEKQKAKSEEHKDKVVILSAQQIRERLIALGLVFPCGDIFLGWHSTKMVLQ